MRLTVVSPAAPPVYLVCVRCGRSVLCAPGRPPVYADQDGRAFVDYYCAGCALECLRNNDAVARSLGSEERQAEVRRAIAEVWDAVREWRKNGNGKV